MEPLKAADLVGKTIESADTSAINVVHITFTDGSKISLWTEIAVSTGFGDIPGLFVSEFEPAQEN